MLEGSVGLFTVLTRCWKDHLARSQIWQHAGKITGPVHSSDNMLEALHRPAVLTPLNLSWPPWTDGESRGYTEHTHAHPDSPSQLHWQAQSKGWSKTISVSETRPSSRTRVEFRPKAVQPKSFIWQPFPISGWTINSLAKSASWLQEQLISKHQRFPDKNKLPLSRVATAARIHLVFWWLGYQGCLTLETSHCCQMRVETSGKWLALLSERI